MTHPHHTTGRPCNCGFGERKRKPARVNKFFTSSQDHKRNKALYNMRWGFPQKRGAVTPEFLEQWIKDQGPYLYHGTTVNSASDILRDGLFPHDDPRWGSSQSQYAGDFFAPRPNHVYMGTKEYVRRGGYNSGSTRYPKATLKIDLRKLDHHRLNPDEDHFSLGNTNTWGNHPVVEKALNRSGDAPPTMEGWEGMEGAMTLGEWADRAELGEDPEESHYSLGMGSIAHEGHIPPEAISLAPEANGSQWILNPPPQDIKDTLGQPMTAATDAKHWTGKLWHGSDHGLLGTVRTPFWASSHKPEAQGFGPVLHPVQVTLKNPALYFGHMNPDSIEKAQAAGNDGVLVHFPEDMRDPSDPYPKRQWAIALDAGAVVPGHDHEFPYSR